MKYFPILKRKEISQIYYTMWMNLKDIMVNERCHSQKDRYFMISFTPNTQNNRKRKEKKKKEKGGCLCWLHNNINVLDADKMYT
jgi:hypothetical protein